MKRRLRVDGAPVEVDPTGAEWRPVPGGGVLVADGRVWTVARAEAPDGRVTVWIDGRRLEVGPDAGPGPDLAAPRPGPTKVRSPLPGRVARVAAAAGDVVDAGAPLVVVEAMKMENVVRAPLRATVTHVWATPGAVVAKGAPLVELAPA